MPQQLQPIPSTRARMRMPKLTKEFASVNPPPPLSPRTIAYLRTRLVGHWVFTKAQVHAHVSDYLFERYVPVLRVPRSILTCVSIILGLISH